MLLFDLLENIPEYIFFELLYIYKYIYLLPSYRKLINIYIYII